MKKLNDIDLYFVTDSCLSRKGIISDVKSAVEAGCKIVQYREKNKSTKEMISEAVAIKKICEGKAVFLVNDRVDVAIAVDADGVHIGQSDISFEDARKILGDDKIIGLTVHNLDEAVDAERIGARYVGLAPIFETDTKEDIMVPCGVCMIEKVRQGVSLPIVAVGGISKDNIGDVIQAGADSVVCISAVVGSDDVFGEICECIKIIKENKSK